MPAPAHSGVAESGTPGRPALGWRDLAGGRVGVWGAGVEGAASLRRLAALGASVVVVVDDPAAPGAGARDLPVTATAAGGLELLAGCEAVVKSPGISRHRADAAALVDAGVPLCGGLGLWLHDAARARVACITGTKGKSTTTAIAGHLAAGLGARCLLAGNIGRPPWDPEVDGAYDWWLVETSSFQATDVAESPGVVAVTSLAPDHLDWHGSVEAYYADKLSLCHQPGEHLTVADATSAPLRAHAALLGPDVRWVVEGDPALDGDWVDALALPGRHYHRDALLARACLVGLGVPGADDDDRLRRVATGFAPLDSRFRPIGEVDGVEFVDDSLSTNVLPTVAALDALGDRPVALLVGGQDRGIDYGGLGDAVAARRAPTLVVTLPASGPRIGAAVRAAQGRTRPAAGERAAPSAPDPPAPAVVDAPDLDAAVRLAFGWALPRRGVVLLSPAAPSFGQFRDYRDRAAAFADAMAACAGRGGDQPA